MNSIVPLAAAMLLAAAGAGCTAKMKESYHLRRADRFYNAGQYEKAEIEYKNAIRLDTQNERGWSHLGFVYFEEGRLAEAAQLLSRAQQLATNDLEVRLKIGIIDSSYGQMKEAREEAAFVLERDPRDNQAPMLLAQAAAASEIPGIRQYLQKLSQSGDTAALETALGTLALRQGDFQTTTACVNRALALDPKFSDAYSLRANACLQQKDLPGAGAALKTAADLAPARSGKMLEYARFKIVTGDPETGKALLEEMVRKMPDYLPAWIGLAELAGAQKKYDEGVTLLGNVLSRDPQNFEALMLKGRMELDQGQAATAVNHFETMARAFPRALPVRYQLARAYLANQNTDQAVATLNQILAADPTYADAKLLLAGIQIHTGSVGAAIDALKELVQKQPQLLAAQLLLAEAYQVQGNPDNAVRIYHELESANPKNPQIPLLLGTVLFEQQKDAEARSEFERALQEAPGYEPALAQMVRLDMAEKRYPDALQRLQKQEEANPKEPELQMLLGEVLFASGETNRAEDAFQKAIQLQPDFQQAYLALAGLYVSSHQDQKALSDLKAASDKDPKNTAAWMLMGMIYDAENNYQAACDAYEKLLALVPDSVVAMNNLAYIYAENLHQPDKAIDLARRARNQAPNDPSVADTFGRVLFDQGQYTLALGPLQESAAKLTDSPEVQFHLGMADYMLGDEANARAAFQRALRLGGNFPETNQCNQCLAILGIDPRTAGADTRAWLEKRVADQPSDAVALARLAAIYQREGDVDKAAASDEALLRINPENVPVLIELARLYESKNPQKAFDLAKSAYNLAPNDSLVTHTAGRLAFITGDYAWSASLLQLTAQAQPQDPDVLFDLGEALYSLGRVPEARTAMQNALQNNANFSHADDARRFLAMTDLADNPSQALAAQAQVDAILKSTPDYVPALVIQAQIEEQKSDFAAAARTDESILAKYPDFAPVERRLLMLYVKDPANDNKAYPVGVKAHEAYPDDPEIDADLGMIVYRQGDYTRAANLLLAGSGQNSRDAQCLFYLGMAEYHLQNRADCKANLQRALDLNLPDPLATEAKRVLAELK